MNVDPFIEAERAQQRTLKRACELLEVSRPPRAATAPHASTLSSAAAATGTAASGSPG